ncbi:MAG TPA: ATP-binding cassette domain-containing protein [Steroidobacteraceae bacterium]|nr:ATP-binding cassette domain-containing protein [Steroidobacteraceae bacterium]
MPSALSRRIPSPLPLLAGLLAAYLIAPLVAGALQSSSARWHSVQVPALLHACGVSLASATAATLLVALGGVPLGYVLARVPGRAMAVLGFLVQLPLALPPLASGVLLLFLVGYDTPLGRLTAGALTDSFAGIVLAEAFVAAPFVIIAARSAFASIDPALEGVAQTLGRRPLEVFWRVSLPVAWPALLSGLLLAWLRAFGEFGATVMVAYHPYSLPVYTYVAFGSQGLPAMLPVLLPALLLAFVVMAVSSRVGNARRAAAPVRATGAGGSASLPRVSAPPASVSSSGPPPPASDLSLSLRKRLEGFELCVDWSPGARRLAVLGPSGSGKSLTLKLIAGLERPDSGTIRLGERDVSRYPPAARAVAYVPQSYGLFPHLTLIEQLCFPVGAEPERAVRWIGRLGLAGLEHRRPAELSLGQQQRVALARALMRPAKLLLMDEPLSALDAPLRAALREELRELQREFAGTMVLVTHDPAEAMLLADELLVLAGGRVLQSGPMEHVYQRPATSEAARLLGAEHPAAGVVAGPGAIEVGPQAVLDVAGPPLERGRRVHWSVMSGRARLSAGGRYEGTVEALLAAGLERHLIVRFGDTHVRVSADSGAWAPGRLCRFDIDPRLVQVWMAD